MELELVHSIKRIETYLELDTTVTTPKSKSAAKTSTEMSLWSWWKWHSEVAFFQPNLGVKLLVSSAFFSVFGRGAVFGPCRGCRGLRKLVEDGRRCISRAIRIVHQSHRYMVLHGSHQYTPVMLAYIPAPWILWEWMSWPHRTSFSATGPWLGNPGCQQWPVETVVQAALHDLKSSEMC